MSKLTLQRCLQKLFIKNHEEDLTSIHKKQGASAALCMTLHSPFCVALCKHLYISLRLPDSKADLYGLKKLTQKYD